MVDSLGLSMFNVNFSNFLGFYKYKAYAVFEFFLLLLRTMHVKIYNLFKNDPSFQNTEIMLLEFYFF